MTAVRTRVGVSVVKAGGSHDMFSAVLATARPIRRGRRRQEEMEARAASRDWSSDRRRYLVMAGRKTPWSTGKNTGTVVEAVRIVAQ